MIFIIKKLTYLAGKPRDLREVISLFLVKNLLSPNL